MKIRLNNHDALPNLKLETAHAHDCLDQGEDDKPHEHSHNDDDGRLQKRQRPLDAGFKSFIKDLINFKKDFLQAAALLADANHIRNHGR